MARGVNKVILIGNCGQDPEVKYSGAGAAICNVTIATSETWKDKTTGQPQEKTEWHRVVFFNRLGEIAGEYLKKGSKVYVEGALKTRKWKDKDGQDRYTTEIVGSEMQMLDSVGGGQAAPPPHQAKAKAPQQAPQYQPQAPQVAPKMAPQQQQQSAPPPGYQEPNQQPQQPSPQASDMESFDDDIPF